MTLKTQFPAPTGKALSSPDNRADLAGLVVRTTAGVPRAGILPRTTAALGTARASMGVDVASFEAVLVRNGLPALIANDGTVTVSIGAAPGANSQYNIVYVKQNESASPFSDGNDNEIFGYVVGTAAPIPDLAAAIALVPAGGLPLLSVLVPSTATTTQSAGVVITPIHPYTALTGGAIWVRTTSELTALTGFAPDQRALALDTGITHRYDGTAWKLWQIPVLPFVKLGMSAGQNLASSGANTPVTWDAEVNDTAGMHDPSTNPSRVTATIAGLHRVTWKLAHRSTTATQFLAAQIRVNGTLLARSLVTIPGTSTGFVYANGSETLDLAVGGYVEIAASSNAAQALEVASSLFEVVYVGPS